MADGPLPWSLKGVSRAARDAAKAAARREGVPLGVWLSKVIRDTSAAESGIGAVEAATSNDETNLNSIERAVARIGFHSGGARSH
jgi:hypothetical protein